MNLAEFFKQHECTPAEKTALILHLSQIRLSWLLLKFR